MNKQEVKCCENGATDEVQKHYEKALQETKNKVYVIILLTLSEPLFSSSRFPFLFLFVQSFAPNVTTSYISILIFCAYAFSAITIIIITGYGDKIGHDKVYIFCFMCLSIGLFIVSIATSFGVFIIGYLIGLVPNMSVAFSYIASVLPHKYAVRYCSIIWSICAIIYLLVCWDPFWVQLLQNTSIIVLFLFLMLFFTLLTFLFRFSVR